MRENEPSVHQESKKVTEVLEKEWAVLVETDFSHLSTSFCLDPGNDSWKRRVMLRYACAEYEAARAISILTPAVWRRRHQIIVQTLDRMDVEQLQEVLTAPSLDAYFGKGLAPKERYEARVWAEGKLRLLQATQKTQSATDLATALFQRVQTLAGRTE